MIKNTIKIICFITIFITLLWFSSRVLRFKNDNGIYQGDSFYEQKTNSIDVLLLGSSHVHYNVNPAILYNEYGIAAYNFTSGSQPIWSTYHYLVEALKYQKPKLIALESYIVAASRTNVVDYQIVAATYALKWSKNRVESLKVTAAERFDEFINPMYRYHNRYKDLKDEDFLPYANNYNHYKYFKGYSFHQKTFPVKKPNIENIKDTLPLLEQQEAYYRKILELAKTNNIPIVVIASPFPMTDDEARHFNRVGEIAKEYDIPFMNFNHYYDDYDLTVEFKQEKDGNSGVFIRSWVEPVAKVNGWQVEVAPKGCDTGGIYESYGRGWIVQIPDEKENILKYGDWNTLRVKVQGNNVQTWLNGQEMVNLDDEKIGAGKGRIALQIHSGGGIKVAWRNLKLKTL